VSKVIQCWTAAYQRESNYFARLLLVAEIKQ